MPRPQRTPEEIEGMRQRILDAAHELIHEGGPANLTMRGVAERLSVSPMTLYGYFSSRQELVSALHEMNFARIRARQVELLARARAGDVLGALEEELSVYRHMAQRRPAVFRLWLAHGSVSDELHCTRAKRVGFQVDFLAQLIDVGIEQGSLVAHDVNQAALVAISMVIGPLVLHAIGHVQDEAALDHACDVVIVQALRFLQTP